jgi:uncharacterized membrane protein (UPF0127 family)
VTIVLAAAPAQATVPLTVETATGRHIFQVDVARTAAEHTRGLMFRKSLPADYGMLFVFHESQPLMFWMKNTYVSLDIIFIGADGRVHHIAADATPLSERLIRSGGPARYVLELPAGTAARIHLAPGDRIDLPPAG